MYLLMSTLIETAGQTAMESVNEVNNASSVELTKTLKVDKDDEGKLRITSTKNEPPAYVDLAVIILPF